MNYLLDTNVCIALMNGNPASVRARVEKEIRAGARLFVSSISLYELWYGVAKRSRDVAANTGKLQAFLAGPVAVLSFSEEDSPLAGEVRAATERAGKPIGSYDLLLAAQALRRKLILVTANAREFSRLAGLKWQNWTVSR